MIFRVIPRISLQNFVKHTKLFSRKRDILKMWPPLWFVDIPGNILKDYYNKIPKVLISYPTLKVESWARWWNLNVQSSLTFCTDLVMMKEKILLSKSLLFLTIFFYDKMVRIQKFYRLKCDSYLCTETVGKGVRTFYSLY